MHIDDQLANFAKLAIPIRKLSHALSKPGIVDIYAQNFRGSVDNSGLISYFGKYELT